LRTDLFVLTEGRTKERGRCGGESKYWACRHNSRQHGCLLEGYFLFHHLSFVVPNDFYSVIFRKDKASPGGHFNHNLVGEVQSISNSLGKQRIW